MEKTIVISNEKKSSNFTAYSTSATTIVLNSFRKCFLLASLHVAGNVYISVLA